MLFFEGEKSNRFAMVLHFVIPSLTANPGGMRAAGFPLPRE